MINLKEKNFFLKKNIKVSEREITMKETLDLLEKGQVKLLKK